MPQAVKQSNPTHWAYCLHNSLEIHFDNIRFVLTENQLHVRVSELALIGRPACWRLFVRSVTVCRCGDCYMTSVSLEGELGDIREDVHLRRLNVTSYVATWRLTLCVWGCTVMAPVTWLHWSYTLMATVSDVSEAAQLWRLISCVRMRQLQLEGEFFYVPPCTLAARCQCFGVIYCLRFHSWSRLSAKGKIALKYSRVSFCDGSFTTIHFYDPCRVWTSTPDLWCITVVTQASFLYLSALLALFRCAYVFIFLF